MTKNEIAALVAQGKGRECFEHSTEGIFDITALREMIAARKVPFTEHTVALADIVPHILASREVCEERIGSLSEASWKYHQIIFLECPGAEGVTHLMVDGHHRAIRRHREGLTTVQAFMVPLAHAPRPNPGWGKVPWANWGVKDIIDGKLVSRGRA